MKHSKFGAGLLALIMLLSTACTAQAADPEVRITLSDSGVTVDGKAASTDDSADVYVGGDIIYYQDGTDSSYGQGTESEKHSAAEAAAHTLVTITQPGTYRLTGSLSKGQIFVDLGKEAKDDPDAVVTLILDNVDVTCTVAPALLFYRVYECDRAFVAYDNDENPDYKASATVETTAAGANVILAAGSVNNFTGSHVARIYKEGTTKKLHKYDAAFYSKMSMNVSGDGVDNSGVLNIVADNEGLDSELHLTINGGTINIQSQDDGINTNEDYVSVTIINGGSLTIDAGLGSEGDGIDSNGYLVINGGNIWTTAHPASDGGIDADSPILLNGGAVSAFGGRNDAASGDSAQPYMELSFASTLPAGSELKLTDEDENTVWTAKLTRQAQSVTLTTPDLALDTTYHLYVDGVLQCWNGNSFGMMHGGGMGGQRPDGQQPPELPDGQRPDGATGATQGRQPEGQQPPELPDGQQPDGATGATQGRQPDGQQPPELPNGQRPDGLDRGDFKGGRPDGQQMPEKGQDFDPAQMGGGRDFDGKGGMTGGFGGSQADGSGSTDFVLTETTKSFSGVCDSDASGKTRVSFTVDGVSRSGTGSVIESIRAIRASVDLPDSAVQITVTDDPSESYALSCLLSDGLEAVNALLPDEDGDYTLTVAVVAGTEGYTGATQISFTVGALPFVDVNGRDADYEAIKVLYRAGAMQGTAEDKFSPNMTVTRAQAITVLARMAGAEQAETDDFSDVEKGAWYAGYVGWAVEHGIVQGDGQGHFYPDMTVTAEQMELMLGRYAEDYVNSNELSGELTRSQLARMIVSGMKLK